MSYCRFSSMDWRCELYCYESDYGWETHVASSKHVLPDGFPSTSAIWRKFDAAATDDERKAILGEYVAASVRQGEMLDGAEMEPIGKPFDGQSFTDRDLESFRDTLIMLRSAGYVFPETLIEDVEEEMRERPND